MSTHQPSLARRLRLVDSWGLTGWGLIAVLVGGTVVTFGTLFVTILFGCRAYGRTTCRHWGEQTGYRSKFVVLNWADTGQCLAKAPNGRWVLNTKVLTFTGRKP